MEHFRVTRRSDSYPPGSLIILREGWDGAYLYASSDSAWCIMSLTNVALAAEDVIGELQKREIGIVLSSALTGPEDLSIEMARIITQKGEVGWIDAAILTEI